MVRDIHTFRHLWKNNVHVYRQINTLFLNRHLLIICNRVLRIKLIVSIHFDVIKIWLVITIPRVPYYRTSVLLMICCMIHVMIVVVCMVSTVKYRCSLWHQLALASCEFYFYFSNHLLDGDLCKNLFNFHILSILWFSITIVSYTLILPISQL